MSAIKLPDSIKRIRDDYDLDSEHVDYDEIASVILEAFKISEPPVDIDGILRGIGFKIFITDDVLPHGSAFGIMVGRNTETIDNDCHIIVRQGKRSIRGIRYLLAIAFCIYIFEQNDEPIGLMVKYKPKEDAYQRSPYICLARAILLPKEEVLTYNYNLFRYNNDNYERMVKISKAFVVPISAVKYRMKDLEDKI